MMDDLGGLKTFLLEAKRRTYAGLDDDATITAPLLPGSKQLEHRSGGYAYRDIYFGMRFFVGQETVARDGQVIWSMAYSGGASADVTDRNALLALYAFLRKALLAGDTERPYRGPTSFAQDEMSYCNNIDGDFARFSGVEEIRHAGRRVYELRYGGGLMR